jgi:hypothetical protein
MHPIAGGWAADPLAGAIGQGGAAIQAHGPLEDAKGSPRANAMQEGSVLLAGLFAQHATDHLKSSLTQLMNAAPINTGIWILQSDHNPMDASP